MLDRVRVGFSPQPGPQQAFLECPCDIVVYGGARGGGKTFASLGEFFLHAMMYGQFAAGLMIRKTREDLKDTIKVAMEMYRGAAVWKGNQGNYFEFTSGARLYMAYLENEDDAQHYQGWSLTRVYIEELTQFHSSAPVMRLLGALRSAHGVKCQMRCTCNPGGPGHLWVKQWVIDHGAYKVVEDDGLTRVFIPALVSDNPALLLSDPKYISRLKAVGNAALVKAWLEGSWDIIEGAFFDEWDRKRHVIRPFVIPKPWLRFRSADWGSAKPFAVYWWAMVQDTMQHEDGLILPRGAIIAYREWYGCTKPNVGLKLTAEQVAAGIVTRETNGQREEISYGVLDPSAYNVVSGPSIGETMAMKGVHFRRADNVRVSHDRKMVGWDQVRYRLKGNEDGEALIFFFSTCTHAIRTIPVLQHDETHAEDLDTEGEDHAADSVRYACMSRPYTLSDDLLMADDDPYLVKNAFKLDDLPN